MYTFKISETGAIETVTSPFIDVVIDDFRLNCKIHCDDDGLEAFTLVSQADYEWLIKYSKMYDKLESLKGECLELISERCIISESKEGDMCSEEEMAYREKMKVYFENTLNDWVGNHDYDSGIEHGVRFCERFFKFFSECAVPFECAVRNAGFAGGFVITPSDWEDNCWFGDETIPPYEFLKRVDDRNFHTFTLGVKGGDFHEQFVEEFIKHFSIILQEAGDYKIRLEEALEEYRANFDIVE